MNLAGANAATIVLGAVFFDVFCGEVPNRIHPVVGVGSLTRVLLRFRPAGRIPEFCFGALIVLCVVGVTGALAWAFSVGLDRIQNSAALPSWLTRGIRIVCESILLSTLFAGRGLVEAGVRMRAALDRSLTEGRAALSHLCSRDPSELTASELCGATVESLSENASDSFVAPLFWYTLATLMGGPGLVAAAVYRAANTLDAMIGYRGRYEYVGKFAARFDDVLNWVPARLSAGVLWCAAALCRYDLRGAATVAWREHTATESPNAGWPMALAAGALNVELTKRDCYIVGRGLGVPSVITIANCERLVITAFGLFTVMICVGLWGLGND